MNNEVLGWKIASGAASILVTVCLAWTAMISNKVHANSEELSRRGPIVDSVATDQDEAVKFRIAIATQLATIQTQLLGVLDRLQGIEEEVRK